MLQNRIAAGTQAICVPVVLVTTAVPIHLGFIRGPITALLGIAYTTAALAGLARPTDLRVISAIAGIGVTWWLLRAATFLAAGIESGQVSATGIANATLLAVMVGLFYWRSIVRLGFIQRFDAIESQLSG